MQDTHVQWNELFKPVTKFQLDSVKCNFTAQFKIGKMSLKLQSHMI